jgi:hypothetical protein
MLKFFCDFCEVPCSGSATRRWERIAGEMGLEVVILQGSNPVIDKHLCDSCITELFWKMVEKHTPNQGLSKLQMTLKSKELELKGYEKDILNRDNELKIFKNHLDSREEALKSREVELEKAGPIIEQARVIKQKESDVIRLAEARGRQQVIDEYDNKRRSREGRL